MNFVFQGYLAKPRHVSCQVPRSIPTDSGSAIVKTMHSDVCTDFMLQFASADERIVGSKWQLNACVVVELVCKHFACRLALVSCRSTGTMVVETL